MKFLNKMIDAVLKFFHLERFKELIVYIVIGGLTTVVDWLVFALMDPGKIIAALAQLQTQRFTCAGFPVQIGGVVGSEPAGGPVAVHDVFGLHPFHALSPFPLHGARAGSVCQPFYRTFV